MIFTVIEGGREPTHRVVERTYDSRKELDFTGSQEECREEVLRRTLEAIEEERPVVYELEPINIPLGKVWGKKDA